MKPFKHGQISARKWGGTWEDYQDIHDFLDQTKFAVPDMRHRCILHNAFGCYLVEQVFGAQRMNSGGREYSPRDVAEQHIIDDLGFIPKVSDYLDHLPMLEWLGGPRRKTKKMTLDGVEIVD